MKKIIMSGLMLATMSVTIIGCKKEKVTSNQKEITQKENVQNQNQTKAQNNISQFSVIGKLHNDGLDFLEKEYKKAVSLYGSMDESSLNNFIRSKTADFLQNKSVTIGNYVINEFPTCTAEQLSATSTVINTVDMETLPGRVFHEMYNITGSYQDMQTKISKMKSDYSKVANETELFQIQAFASVYSSSLEYWYNIQNPAGICWTCVGASDVSGAYSGGSMGSILGPGGVVGGALGIGIMSSGYAAALAALWEQ